MIDFEKIIAQSVITVLAVTFVLSICCLKAKLEKKLTEIRKRVKQIKVRMKLLAFQEKLIWQKVLSESTDRHIHSIIASSLKQTLDEEILQLQHAEKSRKLFQPKLASNLSPVDSSDYVSKFDQSALNIGENEKDNSLDIWEKKNCKRKLRKEQHSLQPKIFRRSSMKNVKQERIRRPNSNHQLIYHFKIYS